MLGIWLGVTELPAAPATTPIPRKGMEISLWAREPMLKNPVALSFDDRGRLYVVETARRSTVDIDIRGHQAWIVDDLANQNIEDLRRFFREKMSPARSLENARWLKDYNGDGGHDWRDLMAVKEKVHLLEDSTGQGKADRARVLVEGFNEEINGVIAGVMPWESDVFVTVYPDLWRLRDTDGDGLPDRQESMFRGFGVHAAFDGHDLHGLTMGPDGKVYFSIGDNGFSVTNREGKLLDYPNTGGVLRMNPDGSDLEVFATGLRNPQEIAFDEFGNLFSVDNDGDLADERERFVYIAEGSDSGWRLHWQFREPGWARYTKLPDYNPWIAERMWVPHHPGQPAHITPPLSNYSVGPGSFKYNPGTALNAEYRRFFFLVQFPVQQVTAFQTKPKGASFEMVNEHLFLGGMMASALNFSPDGALFVADWDGMWAPNEKGAIWRLDDPREKKNPLREEVARLLETGFRGRKVAELTDWLGHDDLRIRQRAQFELVRRAEDAALRHVAIQSDAPQLARVHALWGLSQRRAELTPERLPFSDPDSEIRAQSAKLAGDLRLRTAGAAIRELLTDPSPRVQYHAALALGKLGDVAAAPGLVKLLEQNAGEDPFLRHAAVLGLAGCVDGPALGRLSLHPARAVRIGAVLALRRLRSPAVADFLRDADPLVVREAVRAIHDDRSIPEALPAVAALLERTAGSGDEPVVRRALNANLRLGGERDARRLLGFLLDGDRPERLRVEALDCLAAWDVRPYLDRVEGLIRPLAPRVSDLGNRLLTENLPRLLKDSGAELGKALTRVVLQNRLDTDPEVFVQWAASSRQSPEVRVQALELLAKRDHPGVNALLDTALTAEPLQVRLAALKLLATRDAARFWKRMGERESQLSVPEKQAALRLASSLSDPQGSAFLSRFLAELRQGKLRAELNLDVQEAARTSSDPGVHRAWAAYEQQPVTVNDPLAPYRSTLTGGDPVLGRELFRNHASAQCVRCHEAGGDGYQAGPVLTGIASRVTPEYLLESLIQPSQQIAQGFATVSLALRDGEVVDGTQLRTTPNSITLRLGTGETREFLRRDVQKLSTSTVSAMPPMGEVLTRFELRDILAYLRTLK